ncbi:GTP-binding protein RAD [Trichonephila clavata]|uniref:GTP-binding protein RAD n=1 Tax=Trichonephila clavata TaxID=2740835 RepID=A0A8X6LY09_TRICU|nr:GTP-binding protein RAD [Trichonephila clavata]
MTPVSDLRKMSLMPDIQSVFRSRSDTSYESLASVMVDRRGRRYSEWPVKDDRKMVLRPLQLNEGDQKDYSNGLLYRRLSRASPKIQPISQSMVTDSREGVSRSYSVKSVKKFSDRQRHRGSSIPSDGNHYGVKVKERTVSNRSLPLPGDESDYFRLRNFSVTSKGVINRGDSFRSRSNSNVPGLEENEEATSSVPETTGQPSPLREDEKDVMSQKKTYKVLLLGASGVGKSSMWKQFLTSEYICDDDFVVDREIDKMITVILNNEESQMEFEEETLHGENASLSKPDSAELDAFVIVYSVTDRKSFSQARHVLSQVERYLDSKAVILVANKTDLARLRVVSTEEGKSLAKDRGCKFIETSVAINHQIDELLVGTLSQIRIKAKVADKLKKKRDSHGRRSSIYTGGLKASGVLKKILRKACIKSKSCDNLHVL